MLVRLIEFRGEDEFYVVRAASRKARSESQRCQMRGGTGPKDWVEGRERTRLGDLAKGIGGEEERGEEGGIRSLKHVAKGKRQVPTGSYSKRR